MNQKIKPINKLTLIEHLDELRTRILKCVIIMVLATGGAFGFSKQCIHYLKWPARHSIDNFIFIKPTEIITVYFKLALYVGLIVSAPFILYQAWRFIKPAITQPPKFGLFHWILMALLLFIGGSCFAFFIIAPKALAFLMYLSQESALPMLTLNFYTSFMLALLLLGGLIFEIPLASGFLTKIGLITPKLLRDKQRIAIIIILIFAAILTPTTDIFNLILFAIPMMLLYEVGIWFSIFLSKEK